MNELNLTRMAIDLLEIEQDFNQRHPTNQDYKVVIFDQTWGNTSGGFEGVGGDAIITQPTYVLMPPHNKGENSQCFVYFNGAYAYSVPYSNMFLDDVHGRKIYGKYDFKEYLKGDK